ncbi:MAG: WecB/TagA/CpsF family glycosyltransferase [Chloroflexi bacterium]|nr:MAG: WecB/TagA/CpsF family glycosyltransferase [Chloroflexota bacterium]
MRTTSAAREVLTQVVARVGNFTEESLVEALATTLEQTEGGPATAYGIHVGNLSAAMGDPAYRDALATATYLYADGVSTRVVSQSLGALIRERLVTTDIIWPILRVAAVGKHPVFFLGGRENQAANAADIAASRVPGLRLVGVASGYFPIDDGDRVADTIASTGAHLVIVAMGVPREQVFCKRFGARTGARLLMTSGGLYGYITGQEARAPFWMRRVGLEWAFRLLQSPQRLWARYSWGAIITARLVLAARDLRRRDRLEKESSRRGR